MIRYETKFLIEPENYMLLKQGLVDILSPDRFMLQEQSYEIFSKYYDTPDRQYYYAKVDGQDCRLKIRLRRYARTLNEEGPLFLEAKLKRRATCKKIRIDVSNREGIFNPRNWIHIEEANIEFFQGLAITKALIPTCNVFYKRSAFNMEVNGIRLRMNADSNVCALFPWENEMLDTLAQERQIYSQRVLLEVKYTHKELPRFLTHLLNFYNAERVSFSKYILAMDFLRQLERRNIHVEK